MEGRIEKEGQSWDLLPRELFAIIFTFLENKDLMSVVVVNKQWRDLICSRREGEIQFDDEESFTRFPWSLFPNVREIYITEPHSVLSLRSVPTHVSSLWIHRNNITDYHHLEVTTFKADRITAVETQQFLKEFSALQGLVLYKQDSVPGHDSYITNHLTKLCLSHYNLEAPNWVYQMSSLKLLSISANLSEPVRNEMVDIGHFSNLTNLTELYLIDRTVRNVFTLSHLTNLQVLYMSSVGLFEVPEKIRKLTQLTSLKLSNDGIYSIPELLSDLCNLTDLRLANAKLPTLPDLSPLTRLVVLDASSNLITELRAEHLPTSLETLNLINNKIPSIEESFGLRMTRLTNLDLSLSLLEGSLENVPISLVHFWATGMKITDISYITCLRRLEECDFTMNEISTVPDVSGLTRLLRFHLNLNPCTRRCEEEDKEEA